MRMVEGTGLRWVWECCSSILESEYSTVPDPPGGFFPLGGVPSLGRVPREARCEVAGGVGTAGGSLAHEQSTSKRAERRLGVGECRMQNAD